MSWRKAVCNTLCSYTCKQHQTLSNKKCSALIGTLLQLQHVLSTAVAQETAAPSTAMGCCNTESACMLGLVLAEQCMSKTSSSAPTKHGVRPS